MFKNPFALFEIEPCFDIDMIQLEKKYRHGLAATHPDRFLHEKDDVKKHASQQAQILNEAYEILKNPLKRAYALLNYHNIEPVPVPLEPSFLQHMLDLQDSLENPCQEDQLVKEAHNRLIQCEKSLQEGFSKENYAEVLYALTQYNYLKRFYDLACIKQEKSHKGGVYATATS